MSIASEISRLSTNISNALDAIEDKGVIVPVDANSDNLATLIGLIPTYDTVTPAFEGGSLSGTATASATNAETSTSSNNSGVSISTACTVTRSAVTYDGNTYGIVNKSDGDVALASGTGNMTASTYYINGVTIVPPESGTRTFTITLPNGNDDTITLTFTVDSNGNSDVTDDMLIATGVNF